MDEVDALEASLRRRRRFAFGIYMAVIAAPVVVIGMCVRQAIKQESRRSDTDSEPVTLPPEQIRAAQEIVRAEHAAEGRPDRFAAPATVLAQLRTAAPGDGGCPIALQARRGDVSQYQPPAFLMWQLTPAELALAKPVDTPTAEGVEVIVVVAKRKAPLSTGVDFYPGEVRGRAFVWDHATNQIVCSGDVEAHNSAAVNVQRTTINGSPVIGGGGEDFAILDADLDRQLERAVAAGLHAVR